MKTIKQPFFTSLMALLIVVSSAQAEPLKSLRGDVPIVDINSPVAAKAILVPEDGFDTRWDSQPPSIPHSIDEDKVTLSENTCMNCHSRDNYKKEDSVKIGSSHYYNRDDTKLKKLAARRYFCVQCHTPQRDTNALVENTYQEEE